jgi:DNA-binding CsgD family transcriptional regulator/cell division protein FtsL
MKTFLFFCPFLSFIIDLNTHNIQPHQTKEVDSLLVMVSKEISNVNPVGALEQAAEALSLSRKINYSKGRAISCLYIGQALIYLAEYEKSLEYLMLSKQEKYTNKDMVLQSEISRIKAQVYFYLGLKKASFREFQKAYEFAVKIENIDQRDRHVSLAYENFGIAYQVLKVDPDSSLYWLRENEKLLAKTDESQTFKNKINLQTILGNHYRDIGQYDSAQWHYMKAQSLISQYNSPYSSWLYVHWGDLYMLKGNTDSALIYFRKGLDNIRTTNLKNELEDLYQKISDIYSKRGDEDSARFYREKYLQIKAEFADSRHKTTERAMQILLEEEQRHSRGENRKTFLLIGSVVILIGTVITLSWRRLLKRKNKTLQSHENKISDLNLKLNHAFYEIIELARKNDTSFLPRFREVYPIFTKNLLRRHPDLINTELQLCAMIFLNFSSKEIAEYLFITHRSVQTRKSRLRKKLGISSETDLYQYIKSFS